MKQMKKMETKMTIEDGLSTPLPPIEKIVVVKLSVDEAFRLFTEGFNTWWPLRTHSVWEVDAETCVLEGKKGGRIYEVNNDGRQSDWGTILVWEPPHRFVMTWHPGNDPEIATEVEVQFKAEDNETWVSLSHRNWEKRGDKAKEMRESYGPGWDFVLGEFVNQTNEEIK